MGIEKAKKVIQKEREKLGGLKRTKAVIIDALILARIDQILEAYHAEEE